MKKINDFISESFKYIKDIPLFFTNGKAYFKLIETEDIVTNSYRLAIYVILSCLVRAALFSPKYPPTLDWLEVMGQLLFHIPIVSLAYLIALHFSNINHKVKICLNYVIVQNMITVLIPFIFLAGFINTEVYFFYFVYVLLSIIFILFVLFKFAVLFFYTRLKQILSVGVIMSVIIILATFIGMLNIQFKQLVLFEDPIASEFFSLDCLGEVVTTTNKIESSSKKMQDIREIAKSISHYLESSPSISNEIEFFTATKSAQKLAYIWSLEKEKEIKNTNDKITMLENKISKAKFDHTKRLIYKNQESYKEYLDYLEKYDRLLDILSMIDYETISKLKKSYLLPLTDVEKSLVTVRDIELVKYNIDILNSLNLMQEQSLNMINNHLERSRETTTYLEFLKNTRRYLPTHYDPTPLPSYDIKPATKPSNK